jgi:hypothetical protein
VGPQVTEGLNTVWVPSESGLGAGQRETVREPPNPKTDW